MDEIVVKECSTVEEFDRCVDLQREAFGLPDIEISPRRHLIVSREAGGWTLGAFAGEQMVGFVHHLAAVHADNEIFGYSHMMAVAKDYQNKGVGARLKWAQRDKALAQGRNYIKWTWDPMQARNAHFNLNRLGVVVDTFVDNFYGTDYNADPNQATEDLPGLQSDRLFGNWYLKSARVESLAKGEAPLLNVKPSLAIAIPAEWAKLVREDVATARTEQARVRSAFKDAFSEGLVCAGFERGNEQSSYLLFRKDEV
ncbi:MAG TPA: GNAT family N-acetyltransferase [Pyrinomonadaceae bacterium]